ncbi:MAG: glutaredoxin family protein [Actinobacteria bacterium]|nr:glutaredoxin family protein [Actinomycetota bacterium]
MTEGPLSDTVAQEDTPDARVILVGKPDCHLCDDARRVISAVCDDLGVSWGERSILDDPELADEFWDQIPVTLIDGSIHNIYRVDESRLRAKLMG